MGRGLLQPPLRLPKTSVAVLLSVSLAASGLASCSRDRPPMRWTELAGDPGVISRFEGAWYRDAEVAMLEIRATHPPRLGLRLPRGLTLADGRAVGDEIHFSLRSSGEDSDWSLVPIEEDVIALVRAGHEPSWCGTCTPYYTRLTAPGLAVRKVQGFGARVWEVFRETESRVVNWLIEVL